MLRVCLRSCFGPWFWRINSHFTFDFISSGTAQVRYFVNFQKLTCLAISSKITEPSRTPALNSLHGLFFFIVPKYIGAGVGSSCLLTQQTKSRCCQSVVTGLLVLSHTDEQIRHIPIYNSLNSITLCLFFGTCYWGNLFRTGACKILDNLSQHFGEGISFSFTNEGHADHMKVSLATPK